MEARSYVENIANRTTMRGVVVTMTQLLGVSLVVGAITLIVATKVHPAALIIGLVMLGGAVLMVRDTLINRKELREHPLDLAFDPAPDRGLVTPGTAYGLALGFGIFGIVMGSVSFVGGGAVSEWAYAALGVGATFALMGIPTLGVQRRKWGVLVDVLRTHPHLIEYLQDARARFPKDAPFPFAAPTDEVTIP